MHAYMHTSIHACMHAYMHACMHTYIHAYMHHPTDCISVLLSKYYDLYYLPNSILEKA